MDGAPAWTGRITWQFDNNTTDWLDGYIAASDGLCYDLEVGKKYKDDLYYFSEELNDLVYIMINGVIQ